MPETVKLKYLTKTVKFGGKDLILYSLDGMTWSTRRMELMAVKERHEAQRVTFNEIKGIAAAEEEQKDTAAEQEESTSDEPFELKVDDEVDVEEKVKDKPAQPTAAASSRALSSMAKGQDLKSAAKQHSNQKFPKKGSPAKMQLVTNRTKKSSAKAAPKKIVSANKVKRTGAAKTRQSAKKSKAKRKAA